MFIVAAKGDSTDLSLRTVVKREVPLSSCTTIILVSDEIVATMWWNGHGRQTTDTISLWHILKIAMLPDHHIHNTQVIYFPIYVEEAKQHFNNETCPTVMARNVLQSKDTQETNAWRVYLCYSCTHCHPIAQQFSFYFYMHLYGGLIIIFRFKKGFITNLSFTGMTVI